MDVCLEAVQFTGLLLLVTYEYTAYLVLVINVFRLVAFLNDIHCFVKARTVSQRQYRKTKAWQV